MEPYDPTLEALVAAMLEALDHDAEMTAGYLDQLRQLAYTLQHILSNPEGHEATPEQEQVMRQALGHLDPKNGDVELDYLDVLRRCQAAVDKELFKWDSSIVQPIGWSGEAQVAIGGGDVEPHENVPAENWNRRLQQV